MDEQAKNLNQALLEAMDTYARRTCFHVRRGKRFRAISYHHFQTLTFRLTNFLRSQGITNGKRIAIIADNPVEWMVVYVASLLSGNVPVPLRAWLPPDMLRAMIKDSGACLAVIQGEGQRWLIEDARQTLPECETVLVVNEMETSYPWVLSIATILAKSTTLEEDEETRHLAAGVNSDALASIYYKTGRPRGIVFSHAQRLAAVHSMADWFTLNENDVAITTILAWSLASLDAALHYFLSGVPHVVAESSELTQSRETTPTVILTTPSGFEEFYNSIVAEIQELPSARQALFQWAMAVGREYREAGLAASEELREAYARADLTFFSPIRARTGGNLYRIYSTGAPLPQKWAEFTEIIGTLPLNVYSLTEAGGFPAISRPEARRQSSCGQVAPGFQIRIADDGEVLVRSRAVMQEYWQQPEETRQVLDDDGWLHTGDLGRFDSDGYLYLTGHKQPQIVLSTGRNVTLGAIENALTASPYISQAVLFGEGRNYVTALIAPDLPAVASDVQGRETGSSESLSAEHPQVKALIAEAVTEVNNRLDSWTEVKEYHLLDDPLCEEAGELTSSQKPCRDVVAERYAAEIEALYPQAIQFEQKDLSQVQLELEELHELLEKQDILDAWLQDAGIGFLFELARAMQIDAPSMVHICDTVAAIAQAQSEEKPLSTALIVGDPTTISHHLVESEIQLQRFDHIRRMRQIVISLAKMVDGLVLGYMVDKHGYLRGVYKLGDETPDEASNFLLGPQFRHHAALSLGCEALVFFVPAGGRQARVFADGQLVGRYANGSWSAESIPHIDEAVARLAKKKECDLALLQRILRCAFQMSEENLGAIFLVGDAEGIMKNSDPPEISTFATIVETNLDRLSDRELINFAKQDGATVIDLQGRLKACMVLLRPRANTKAEIGPGRGARHSSAAKMSAEAKCLAITVSQDGPITVYDSGSESYQSRDMFSFGREACNHLPTAEKLEWLITNGIGGYACGTVSGLLTRRYHGLLVAALQPPLGRTLLLAKLDETATYRGQTYLLFANRWADSTVDPRGFQHIERFHLEGTTPVWTYACADALLEKRVWLKPFANTTYIHYRLRRGTVPMTLTIKTLINFRDYHASTSANNWQMQLVSVPHGFQVTPYAGASPFYLLSQQLEAKLQHSWYRGYFLSVEAFRGLDAVEDHLHAGNFRATLSPGESLTLVASTDPRPDLDGQAAFVEKQSYERRVINQGLKQTGSSLPIDQEPQLSERIKQLVLAASQFVVRRPLPDGSQGCSIIAGYPWFGDWGRDTMIALPGLTLCTGQPEIARTILQTYAQHVDEGMLPNRFPDTDEGPEYNTVDAALWYFRAVHQYFLQTGDTSLIDDLFATLVDILDWYRQGTLYNIHVDPEDGLLYAGEPGFQLTWMDAKIGDWVITPRIGKPVEINALWHNALRVTALFSEHLGRPGATTQDYIERADFVAENFRQRFWYEAGGYLCDVIDGPGGDPGYDGKRYDRQLRPNQIFAVSLPFDLLDDEQAKSVVDICAGHLLTPHGLRSLAPNEAAYVGRYGGNQFQRDAAYHQGTVWAWLLGPFVRAHFRVYQDPTLARSFLLPLIRHLAGHCIGNISEIFDGDPPFRPMVPWLRPGVWPKYCMPGTK